MDNLAVAHRRRRTDHQAKEFKAAQAQKANPKPSYPYVPLLTTVHRKQEGKYVATGASGFKVGDLVTLKAGGPVMTVNTVPDGKYMKVYRCQWFAGKKLEGGTFMLEELQAAESQPPIPVPSA